MLKKSILFTVIVVLMMSCGSQGNESGSASLESTDSLVEFEINQDRTDAVVFNNEMTFMQEGILDLVDELFQSDSSNVDMNLENCRFELKMNVSKLQEYQKDTLKADFINDMIGLMQFYEKEFSGQFLEIASILKKPVLTEEDRDELKSYDETFVQLEEEAFEKVFISQESYAKNNNILLDFDE